MAANKLDDERILPPPTVAVLATVGKASCTYINNSLNFVKYFNT